MVHWNEKECRGRTQWWSRMSNLLCREHAELCEEEEDKNTEEHALIL